MLQTMQQLEDLALAESEGHAASHKENSASGGTAGRGRTDRTCLLCKGIPQQRSNLQGASDDAKQKTTLSLVLEDERQFQGAER